MSKKIKIRFTIGTKAYSGSLCQINADEDPVKGFLVWDTNNKKIPNRFIPVENPYKTIVLKLKTPEEADKFIANEKISPETKIKIKIDKDIPKSVEQEIQAKFLEAYNLVETPTVVSSENIVEQHREQNAELLLNYNDPEFQRQIIKEWLEENGYDGEMFLTECVKIHNDCLSRISSDHSVDGSKWELVELRWNNIGAYGSDNYVNFGNVNGITGLFGPNRIGKSTILEVISFAIYGTFIREWENTIDGINDYSNEAFTEIILRRQGILYKITRSVKKTSKGGTVGKLDFRKKIDDIWDDDNCSLNQNNSRETEHFINKLFGTHDDLLFTAISRQEKFAGLIDSTMADRKIALYRFFNLDFFEELYTLAKQEITNIETQRKLIQRTSNPDQYKAVQNKQEIKKKYVEEETERLTLLQAQLKDIANSIDTFKKSINIVESPVDVQTVQDKISWLKNRLTNIVSERKRAELQKQSDEDAKERIKKEVGTLLRGKKSKEVVDLLNVVSEYENKKQKTSSTLRVYQEKEKNAQRSLDILNQQPWVHENEYCHKCMFLADAWVAEKELAKILENVEHLKSVIQECNEKLAEIGYSSQEINKINDLVNRFDVAKTNVNNHVLHIEKLNEEEINQNNELTENERILADHADLLKILSENESITKQINKLELDKHSKEKEIHAAEQNIVNGNTELGYIAGNLKLILEQLQTASDLDNSVKFYKAYMECTSKDGLPFQIIKHILPKINSEVNRIISEQTTNWKINLTADKSKLKIGLIENKNGVEMERSVEGGSGAERIISSMALRVALLRLSFLPRASFMVIDEGLNSLDEVSLESVEPFLYHIRQYFDFLMLISHVPQLKEKVDSRLIIESDGIFSKIVHY